MTDEAPKFQRNGESDPNGKKSVRQEFLTTEAMDADISAVSALLRIPRSEYLRRCVERSLYGEIRIIRRSLGELDE